MDQWCGLVLFGKTSLMEQFAVLLPAAGRSIRYGGPRSKLLEPLGGVPVIRRAIEAFIHRSDVACIVIATGIDQSAHEVLGLADREPLHPKLKFTPGGTNRAESVKLALQQVPYNISWVAVHDAARPLVSQPLIDSTFAAAQQYGAAVPALPVQLTVKQAQGPLPAKVQRTLPRHTLWAMQTPQVMRRADLLSAYAKCPLPLEEITDDVQLLELAGQDVWLVQGEEQNIKITTPADRRLAELLLETTKRLTSFPSPGTPGEG
jgi:2-C-methyl-D-erythritol 4-phosphate cytidylyltransferase